MEFTQRAFLLRDASRLRLQTIVRLRWIAILGQLASVCAVPILLDFAVPMAMCLTVIALSAWLNVFLAIRFPARYRLSARFAGGLLAYDIVQLAALLYLTGGIDNPFTMLFVAPVTVSAATLPLRHTIALGALAALAALFLINNHLPMPWYDGMPLHQPYLYQIGIFVSVTLSMTFLALYVWRLTKESLQMAAALAATDVVLAHEQKLHALDGLAAAAAHELGTPLSTITLVAKELERALGPDSPHHDDIALLKAQAQRCREILQKLTTQPTEQDPLHSRLSVVELVQEAAGPYQTGPAIIDIRAKAMGDASPVDWPMPVGVRRPGVIYGLGNIIENATDFAKSRVDVVAEWSPAEVLVTISDDGPGFAPDLIENIGEPYVTTRPNSGRKLDDDDDSGLGLGFFIAKTLLERSGAVVTFGNRAEPATGALVGVSWPRSTFEVYSEDERLIQLGRLLEH